MACKVARNMRRAQKEAAIIEAVSHPNVVRSLGAVEPGLVLMEYLEGPTLAAYIESRPTGRMSVGDSLRAAIHLGAALEHAHRAGIVHMDVKPANAILVAGRPVLFDFGGARYLADPRPDKNGGTDPYMAPEEHLLQPIGPAADVFSLGATLYEMLTGETPFRDLPASKPLAQTFEAPTPLKAHRPHAPAALQDIVHRCLARDPAERPALSELLPALHDLVKHGPRMWPAGFEPLKPGLLAA
jgi:serine/threonine protein kinase